LIGVFETFKVPLRNIHGHFQPFLPQKAHGYCVEHIETCTALQRHCEAQPKQSQAHGQVCFKAKDCFVALAITARAAHQRK
jgi:hypothetical protein